MCARVLTASRTVRSLQRERDALHDLKAGQATTFGSPRSLPRTGLQPTIRTQRPIFLCDCVSFGEQSTGWGSGGLGRAHRSAQRCIYVPPNDAVTKHPEERGRVSRVLNHGPGNCAMNPHLSSFPCTRNFRVSDRHPPQPPPLGLNQTLINLFCCSPRAAWEKAPFYSSAPLSKLSTPSTFYGFTLLTWPPGSPVVGGCQREHREARGDLRFTPSPGRSREDRMKALQLPTARAPGGTQTLARPSPLCPDSGPEPCLELRSWTQLPPEAALPKPELLLPSPPPLSNPISTFSQGPPSHPQGNRHEVTVPRSKMSGWRGGCVDVMPVAIPSPGSVGATEDTEKGQADFQLVRSGEVVQVVKYFD